MLDMNDKEFSIEKDGIEGVEMLDFSKESRKNNKDDWDAYEEGEEMELDELIDADLKGKELFGEFYPNKNIREVKS